MLALAEEYPHYSFEKHKGYGTKLHYEALREHGVSPVHRRSFLKKIL
jgi:ribonuclease HII